MFSSPVPVDILVGSVLVLSLVFVEEIQIFRSKVARVVMLVVLMPVAAMLTHGGTHVDIALLCVLLTVMLLLLPPDNGSLEAKK